MIKLLSLLLLTSMTLSSLPPDARAAKSSRTASSKPSLSPEESKLLADLERRAFDYFIHEADPRTGLVKDRAANFGSDKYYVASMAATGFGMAALVVGAKRGYLPRKEAYRRALRHLQFAATMPHLRGWFYHFVDMKTGERVWNCEVSTIDTALWVAGALAAGAYFKGTEVDRLAQRLYRRMDFNTMRTDGGAKPDELLISHGWKPETRFLRARWNTYSEHPVLTLLALSSPTHPVPKECWTAWKRDWGEIGPYKALGIHLPLFVHQYVHCFTDLRGKTDGGGIDYWANSVEATKANRWFAVQHADKYPGFGPHGWGITAVDGPDGYRAYAPQSDQVDGTLSPMGVVAALPFLPEESRETLAAMKRDHGERIWGRYGFSAYNVGREWRGSDMVGIDAGAALLLLDRYRFGEALIPALLDKAVMRRGQNRAGFSRARR
ncbi:MAG: hypothetical protein KY468_09365 [Armatimonadetes bacterium]|nr:hypothetical protein [Armatimonadota bacterium]